MCFYNIAYGNRVSEDFQFRVSGSRNNRNFIFYRIAKILHKTHNLLSKVQVLLYQNYMYLVHTHTYKLFLLCKLYVTQENWEICFRGPCNHC